MRILPSIVLFAALGARADVATLDPMTVTATRAPEPRSSLPFTLDVLSPDAFEDPAALTVDGALRESADFSLFRRNDSTSANPTTQGVSLRGLGPSGASRSLVLLDGVPLNDPFGGWVPWSAVPAESVGSAEIVPGGGAAAWGNAALAGVIQIFSREMDPGTGSASFRAGDFSTSLADLSQAVALGPGTLELRGETFETGGTSLVAAANRGPVDTDAPSRHNVESARWRGSMGAGTEVAVTLRRFEEWRDNGTAYQQNHIRTAFGSVALTGRASPDVTWSLTGYAEDQDSSQAFSSVNATRTLETPASLQFDVPASAVGLAGSASLREASRATTTLGADLRSVGGETREDFLYSKGAYTEQRFAGGRQAFGGLFAERTQPLASGLHAIVGARIDHWEDTDGHLRNTTLATGALLLETLYPDRAGTEFSPSAGLTWQASKILRFHAAVQHAFRQPTLNELYRPFRQGNTTTLANPSLSTEHADTGEVGATWGPGPLTLSLTAFAARLTDPVANVTLAQGPGTFPLFGALAPGSIGQERLNLGRIDTHGAQFGGSWNPLGTVSLEFSGLAESATVAASTVAPLLVGKTVPEVPRWSASLGLKWRPLRSLTLAVRSRASAFQYDDDQNQLRLGAYEVVDVSARISLSAGAELFAGVDNLGDSRIETAHSALGVFNIATGRFASSGVRLNW